MLQKHLAAVEAISFSTVRNQVRVHSCRREKRNPYWPPRFTPESPAECPFFLSSHPSKNLTTDRQDAFNSPTNSGEEPQFHIHARDIAAESKVERTVTKAREGRPRRRVVQHVRMFRCDRQDQVVSLTRVRFVRHRDGDYDAVDGVAERPALAPKLEDVCPSCGRVRGYRSRSSTTIAPALAVGRRKHTCHADWSLES